MPLVDPLDGFREEVARNYERACSTLYWIDARDGSGLIHANLWAHQQLMARTMLEQRRNHQPCRIAVVKTRRAGTSTAAATWTFHGTYWRPRQHALVIG